VKGDVVHAHAVDLRFRPRDAGKNVHGAFFRSFRDAGRLDNAADFLPRIVGVFSVMRMAVVVFAGVSVFMPAVMRMAVFVRMAFIVVGMFVRVFIIVMVMRVNVFIVVGVVFVMAFYSDNGARSANTAALVADKIQRPAGKPEFGKLRAQGFGADAYIDKSAQGHIAGNSGRAVKMQCFHFFIP
jgi:hypothetical protein